MLWPRRQVLTRSRGPHLWAREDGGVCSWRPGWSVATAFVLHEEPSLKRRRASGEKKISTCRKPHFANTRGVTTCWLSVCTASTRNVGSEFPIGGCWRKPIYCHPCALHHALAIVRKSHDKRLINAALRPGRGGIYDFVVFAAATFNVYPFGSWWREHRRMDARHCLPCRSSLPRLIGTPWSMGGASPPKLAQEREREIHEKKQSPETEYRRRLRHQPSEVRLASPTQPWPAGQCVAAVH